MNIFIGNESKTQLGGGMTFIRNIKKAFGSSDIKFVSTMSRCDILFIPSASLITKEMFDKAVEMKKKIVLRVDNIIRDSRNRNTGTSRLRKFAEKADIIVYQSQWAKDYVGRFIEKYCGIKKRTVIIHNGVDQDIFNTNGRRDTKNIYLFVHYNRDENKRFPEAADWFRDIAYENKDALLILAGMFSAELQQSNFDFYMGEHIEYRGIIYEPRVMAAIMKSCDTLLFPSFSDACPNTVIEALACGMKIKHAGHSSLPEIMKAYEQEGIGYFSLQNMADRYKKVFESI